MVNINRDTLKKIALKRADPTRKVEKETFEAVNIYRKQKGLEVLTFSEKLSAVAREHSKRQADKIIPGGHREFQGRVEEVAKEIPYTVLAENVAHIAGYSDPAGEAVKRWEKSKSHRQAMEETYTFTGVGASQGKEGDWFITQLFIKA